MVPALDPHAGCQYASKGKRSERFGSALAWVWRYCSCELLCIHQKLKTKVYRWYLQGVECITSNQACTIQIDRYQTQSMSALHCSRGWYKGHVTQVTNGNQLCIHVYPLIFLISVQDIWDNDWSSFYIILILMYIIQQDLSQKRICNPFKTFQNRIFHPHHFSQPFFPSFPWADPRHPPSVRRAATGAEKVWRSARWPWHGRPRASVDNFGSTLAGFFHGNACISNIWKYPLYLLWIFIWIWKYPLYLVLLENTNLFGNEVNEDSLENVCRCRIIHCWSKNA